ncbi:helix-turn-helix transcriptional regulator [Haloarchaeobius sp. HRN-SO-5]|uniref:helix-turn-helix transcriptional regulator n=1 Tax=Haloarchaeobius sp. HRN-SO-5 TaxID=3446118 RepID=UPI003EB800B4
MVTYDMSSFDAPGTPLEEIEFLSRSPNRVRVLDALSGEPRGRYELEDSTGVTRATLGRILDDFVERGWVREDDRRYQTTQLGAYVSREINHVLERFEPVPALNEVAEWFPEEGFGFDLGNLAGSTVVRSTRSNALAPTAHISKRVRTADQVRLITYSVLPGVMGECWRGIVDGRLELESVLNGGAVESFGADPQLIEQAREMAETEQSEVYLYNGDIPSTVFVVDDVVLLCLSGGEGAPRAVIETDDEVVRSWAETRIDELRSEGKRLDPSLFTA